MGDEPGFDFCGAIIGAVRSCYSVACRWYQGGPVGRIRYYFAPPTNRFYFGDLAFGPGTETEQQFRAEDDGGTGQVGGAPRAYDRGVNYRPDLDGAHPFGTAEEFAGLALVPAEQPPAPDCTVAPGIPMALGVDGTLFFGAGHPAEVYLSMIVDDTAATMPALWLRPEELAGFSEGQDVPTWPRAPATPRDAVYLEGPVGTRQLDAATGWPGLYCNGSVLGGQTLYRFDALPTLADWTTFVVARTALGGTHGPLLYSDGGLHIWLACSSLGLRVAVFAGGTTQVTDGVPPVLGELLTVGTRSEAAQWTCERDAAATATGAGVLMTQPLRRLGSVSDGSAFGGCVILEVIVYDRALSVAERAAVWQHLADKYQGVIMVPTGTVLAYGAASVPAGYLACDGAAVSRVTYAALFGVVGTTWGAGDGSTTFNLPDLRDRVVIGTSPGGLGGGRPTARTLAANGGDEVHQLVEAELPAHSHNVPIDVSATPGTATCMGEANSGSASVATGTTGSDQAHNNMQPFSVVTWIIKT